MIYVFKDTIIGHKMNSLSINTIINPELDTELTAYKILGTFKEYLSNIRQYKIYPALSELVGLAVRLESLRNSFVKPKYSGDDLFILDEEISAFGELQTVENYSDDLDESSEFINWIISQINPILDEGIAVYDYVDQNMELKLVNNQLLNKEEGYLIIPDNKISVFNIYKFNCVLFKSENYPERSLKTKFIRSVPQNKSDENRNEFRNLLKKTVNQTLPVYFCETELDFPYEETIFQIAKKKLLGTLSS